MRIPSGFPWWKKVCSNEFDPSLMGDEKNELIPLLIIHINESQPIFPALFSPGPNKRGI